MKIIQLYQDFGLDYKTEGHKHCRPGWVNVECPFCVGNPGYHLGFEVNNEYFYCWRCGAHPLILTLSKLLNLSNQKVYDLVKQYGGQTRLKTSVKDIVKKAKIKDDVHISITRGGVKRSKSYKKYKLVTTHTGRRSFATNLYLRGVPTLVIMAITGHKTEAAFLRYIKVTPKQHAEKIKAIWEKQVKMNVV